MEYRKLGHTEINVSLICLGTMTWGEQNTEQQAHQQLDAALAAGVNFIDTAEMYPVPPKAETQGRTETYIGSWLAKRSNRSEVVLASKVCGAANWLPYLRDGKPRLNRMHIEQALHASLKRLQTDYIDLYQLHWPDRNTNFFGKLGYTHSQENQTISIEETLAVLNDFVDAGKIRMIGVSNETPWGVMGYLQASNLKAYPRIVSIQNPYNLLNRTYEIGLAEVSHREQVGLLAYSPLAFGVLTGKYLNQAKPDGCRLTLFERFNRYNSDEATAATAAYVELAKKHELDPAQMALAYVNSRPFLTSTIIGATNLEQLKTNLTSVELSLSQEVLDGIEKIHQHWPNPSP